MYTFRVFEVIIDSTLHHFRSCTPCVQLAICIMLTSHYSFLENLMVSWKCHFHFLIFLHCLVMRSRLFTLSLLKSGWWRKKKEVARRLLIKCTCFTGSVEVMRTLICKHRWWSWKKKLGEFAILADRGPVFWDKKLLSINILFYNYGCVLLVANRVSLCTVRKQRHISLWEWGIKAQD